MKDTGMPGCARPIAPYQRLPNQRRGQKRGIVRVDARTREGRLLRDVRKTLLEHVGPDPTPVQKSLIERASWLELKLALLDAKIARHCDSEYDSATYLSWVGHLRRLYQTLGIGRPAPKFAELMKSPPKPRKTEAA
jgi:hypothetical protein